MKFIYADLEKTVVELGPGQSFEIVPGIQVTAERIQLDVVRLGITTPDEILIRRMELPMRIKEILQRHGPDTDEGLQLYR